MQRFRHFRRLTPAVGGFALAVAAACGGDDEGADPEVDAELPDDIDADVSEADAATDAEPPAELDPREGNALFLQTTVFAPDGTPAAGGPAQEVEYIDPTTGDGSVVVDEGLNGCSVTTFSEGDQPPTQVDEGPITLTGANLGDEDGTITCAFADEAGGYSCTLAVGEDADLDISGENDTVVLTIDDSQVATTHDLAGSWVVVGGLAEEALNDAPYPVVGSEQDGDDSRFFLATDIVGDGETEELENPGEGAFAFTIDPGPFPANLDAGLLFDASDPETDSVTAVGGDTDNIDPYELDTFPLGTGMELASGTEDDVPYLQPHEFLASEDHSELEEVRFSCASDVGNEDGVCDENVDLGDLDGITALVVVGETTDVPVEDLTDPADPLGVDDRENWAEFECIFTDNEVSVSDAVIDAILDTDPTMVQTGVNLGNTRTQSRSQPPRQTVTFSTGHFIVGLSNVAQDEE